MDLCNLVLEPNHLFNTENILKTFRRGEGKMRINRKLVGSIVLSIILVIFNHLIAESSPYGLSYLIEVGSLIAYSFTFEGFFRWSAKIFIKECFNSNVERGGSAVWRG